VRAALRQKELFPTVKENVSHCSQNERSAMAGTTPVSDAHVIDDLQKELFRVKAEARAALALLEVLPHAVANGRTAVVEEYIDRVTGHVEKAARS
jgi:hypothetical protein